MTLKNYKAAGTEGNSALLFAGRKKLKHHISKVEAFKIEGHTILKSVAIQ